MEKYVGPITNGIIDSISKEIKKKKTKEKIMTGIIDPLLCDLTTRYYPHLMTITIILVVIVLLLISILVLSVLQRITDETDFDNQIIKQQHQQQFQQYLQQYLQQQLQQLSQQSLHSINSIGEQ